MSAGPKEHSCRFVPNEGIRIVFNEDGLNQKMDRWQLVISQAATEQNLEDSGDTIRTTAVSISHCPYCGTDLYEDIKRNRAIPGSLRQEIFENYKQFTVPGGLNVFSVFVKKPFIAKAPDAEATAHKWGSGELLTYYHDWRIEYCTEEIFDCMSSRVIPSRRRVVTTQLAAINDQITSTT